ncbi:hypothetical protein C1I61_08295 [Streptococcus intermedius]|nr:hypothetical protein C1I61_08295 [Streptococcus intermedius]
MEQDIRNIVAIPKSNRLSNFFIFQTSFDNIILEKCYNYITQKIFWSPIWSTFKISILLSK